MKIVFLDIDGVLNSEPFLQGKPGEKGPPPDGDWSVRYDRRNVERLQTLLDRTGAKIVVSSSWRNDLNITAAARLAGLSQLGYIASLVRRSGAPRAEFIGLCPDGNRGESIYAWVTAHPEVTRFVCLDDADMKYMHSIEEYVVQTSVQHGLQDEHVDRAAKMLE